MREAAALVPLVALALASWARDRYRFHRATALRVATRTQWGVLLGLYPLWVISVFSLSVQVDRADAAAACASSVSVHLLTEVASLFVLNDEPILTASQVASVAVAAPSAFAWLAFDLLTYGQPSACEGEGEGVAMAEWIGGALLLAAGALDWLRARFAYHRARRGVTAVQWLALGTVVPLLALLQLTFGLQVSRGEIGGVVTTLGVAVLRHYAVVLVLNDSFAQSAQQLKAFAITAGMAYAWCAHDYAIYGSSDCTDIGHARRAR